MFKRYMYLEGLTNLLGSGGKYLINNDGQIKDIKGNDIESTIDQDGHKVVYCQAWNGVANYRVIDLVAIQFKDLRIPKEDYDNIIAFVIDGNKDNLHASNIGYRFKGGKLEVKGNPGYYYIPNLTNAAINVDGDIISTISGLKRAIHIVKPTLGKTKGGYRVFGINFNKKYFTYSRHRALSLVFKEYPDNVDSLQVNHNNGKPGDDRLDNLEWCTPKENNLHASATGLKSQNIKVLVKNVLTNEVVEYFSITEASRALGFTTDEAVRFRLYKSNFGTIFNDGTQLKLKSDIRDWINHQNLNLEIRKANSKIGTAVISRDCKTLEEKIHPTIIHASKFTGINSSIINNEIILDSRSIIFGFQFKTLNDTRSWKEFTNEEYELSLFPNGFKAYAKNLFTNEEIKFKSIREAGRYFGIIDNFNCKFKQRKQILLNDYWQVKITDDAWENIKILEEDFYKLQKTIVAKCELTDKIIICDSAQQMSNILKLDSKALRVAAFSRGNKIYHGYRFRLGVTNEPWPTTHIS